MMPRILDRLAHGQRGVQLEHALAYEYPCFATGLMHTVDVWTGYVFVCSASTIAVSAS
jgi:hypothetical protein